MNASYEQINNFTVKFIFTVDGKQFTDAINKAFNQNKKNVSMPGFRKGKVSRQMIESYYGKRYFWADAVDIILPIAYEAALDERDEFFTPVDMPNIDITSISIEDGIVFSAEVTVEPDPELNEYKGLTYSTVPEEITDEDVEAEITREQERNGRLVTVEREAKEDDECIIDFQGFIDDIPFEGGSGKNHNLKIGGKTFIKGFEEQIIGHVAGEEFDVSVTFPEDYHHEPLKGQPAVFKVKLSEVRERILPDIDDDFAMDVSEFDTLKEYRLNLKEQLTENAQNEFNEAKRMDILIALADSYELDIPECMIETSINERLRDISRQFGGEITIEAYAGYMRMTTDEAIQKFTDEAKQIIKFRLALFKIANIENIEISEQEIDEHFNKSFSEMQFALSEDQQIEVRQNKHHRRNAKKELLFEAALMFIVDNAVYAAKEETA